MAFLRNRADKAAAVVLLSLLLAYGCLVAVRQVRERVLYHTLSEWHDAQYRSERTTSAPPRIHKSAVPILIEWIEGDDILPSDQERTDRFLRVIGWRVFQPSSYLRQLALCGFDLLGSDASSAVPRLIDFARQASYESDIWTKALCSIGDAAFPVARELMGETSPQKAVGAFLLGGIQTRKAESIALLLESIEDDNRFAKSAAFNALAEMPDPAVEEKLLSKLRAILQSPEPRWSDLHETVPDAAYALHSGAAAALIRLADLCIGSTNSYVIEAALAAFILRDELPSLKKPNNPRHEYLSKRKYFDQIQLPLNAFEENDLLFRLIRSNLKQFGEPRVRETLRTMGSPTNRSRKRDRASADQTPLKAQGVAGYNSSVLSALSAVLFPFRTAPGHSQRGCNL